MSVLVLIPQVFSGSVISLQKKADGGISKDVSIAVTRIINAFDKKTRDSRWAETKMSHKIFGDDL